MSAHNAAYELAAAPVVAPDPGDGGTLVAVTNPTQFSLVSEGAETRTLADPVHVGSQVAISLRVDGGDVTITCESPINQTGNTSIALGDAGDFILLAAVNDGVTGTMWRVVANDGCTLST